MVTWIVSSDYFNQFTLRVIQISVFIAQYINYFIVDVYKRLKNEIYIIYYQGLLVSPLQLINYNSFSLTFEVIKI